MRVELCWSLHLSRTDFTLILTHPEKPWCVLSKVLLRGQVQRERGILNGSILDAREGELAARDGIVSPMSLTSSYLNRASSALLPSSFPSSFFCLCFYFSSSSLLCFPFTSFFSAFSFSFSPLSRHLINICWLDVNWWHLNFSPPWKSQEVEAGDLTVAKAFGYVPGTTQRDI